MLSFFDISFSTINCLKNEGGKLKTIAKQKPYSYFLPMVGNYII